MKNIADVNGMPAQHRVKRRQSDGSIRTYIYAWRGGPSIGIDGAGVDIDQRQRELVEKFYRPPQERVSKGRAPLTEKDALRRVVQNARQRAAIKKTNFSIDLPVVVGLLRRQNGRCAISGIPFDLAFDAERSFSYNPYGISIDRIDCAEGYTRKNIRLVLTAINFALNEWGEDVYLRIAKAVVGKHLAEAA